MPSSTVRLGGVLAAVLALLCLLRFTSDQRPAPAGSQSGLPVQTSQRPGHAPATATPRVSVDAFDGAAARLRYGSGWNDSLPPAMAAFRAWTERYLAAPGFAARLALEADGVALARARRPEMRRLIITDPQRALAVTIPAALRASLPATVQAELETRHSGRGEFALQASLPEPGQPRTTPALRRVVYLGGTTYTAHPYGRREPQLAKEDASLHGIALDGEFALHESPLRIFEKGEAAFAAAEPACAGCSANLAPSDAARNPLPADVELVALEGRIVAVHESELEALERRALQAEDGQGPRVGSIGRPDEPPRAADAPVPHTVGNKQVLVIRVDFSDFQGEPISQAAAQNVMDGTTRTYFEDFSYGDTTLTTTVTSEVYRMPRTGASYATANDSNGLHTDARNLAAAQYTLSSFDRIIVVFPNVGTGRVTGSRFPWAGLGIVSGTNMWINGGTAFTANIVGHELGHTYGLRHSNLWRVRESSGVSAVGNTVEYGDPFDLMGNSSTINARHHFNMWGKNRLGWLPDAAVTNVTRSGTYRVHRFDSRAAPRTQPLALRVFRDGVRWYWIGLRQNFVSGTPTANGAHVIWGHNQRLQTQLLDLNTPGAGLNDAAVPVGATFTDPLYGVTIKPVARGGEDPAQWLDIEVTVPDSAPNVVSAWGREGVTFYDTETGEDVLPSPETNVPMDLIGVQAISGGEQHVVALKIDGTVAAWGNHTAGQIAVPAGLGNVVSVAAGANISGAVLADGSVRIWGDSNNPSITPPAELGDVVELAFGRNHALALRRDGTVVAWGTNSAGQATVPPGLAGVTAITAGAEISVALRRDGTVVTWGIAGARVPAGLANVRSIASFGALNGGQFVVAVRTDGTVVAWGANNLGQTNIPPGLDNVVAVAAGAFHTLALRADGSVVAWGAATTNGRLTVPPALPRATALTATQGSSFALTGTSLRVRAQPQPQTVAPGAPVALRVDASSTTGGTITYQWRKDGVAIAGATAATLSISQAAAANAGVYDVVISSGGQSFTSARARLALDGVIVPTNPGRIANLSIRTSAGSGDDLLIVGVGLGGSGTLGNKAVLIRGVGPTLTAFGLTTALADPVMTAFQGQTQVAQNDDWTGTFDFASLGAFAFTGQNPRDAAIYNAAMASGSYSIQVAGKNNAAGIVLAEIYDATPAPLFTFSTPRLVNVSARTQVGTGDNILIAGFVIAGSSPVQVLIRATGPTLTSFGVGGALVDPVVDVFNAANVQIARNDDWGGTAELKAAFSSVAAFPFVTDRSFDSALTARLNPGSYTVQVRGVANATGVALIEIYELP